MTAKCFSILYLLTVPSAPPSSVRLSVKSSTSINVRGGPVDCRHRNGEIEGYSVRSGTVGVSEEDRAVRMVSGSTTTLQGLTKQTVYTVEVAARTSAGTGVYSQPQTIETPDSEYFTHDNLTILSSTDIDVFLSLNGAVIPNHGYVLISGIGSSDDTALLCHTNRPPPCGGPNTSGGEWRAPNGTKVMITSVKGSGFRKNRGSMVVRLKKITDTNAASTGITPSEGIYRCSILNAALKRQTVYVGLYNSGGGMLFSGFVMRD